VRKSLAREATLVGKRGWAATKLIISAANTCTRTISTALPFPRENGGRGRCVGVVWCGVVWLRHLACLLACCMQPRFLT
jgi:hypothetical protein